MNPSRQPDPIRILRIFARLTETSAPYNQFTLALRARARLTLCTYQRSSLQVPEDIQVHAANGRWLSLLRTIRQALAADRYDVVHIHSPLMGLFYCLATLGRRSPCPPAMLTVHNSYPNFKWRDRLLLLLAFVYFDRIVCCGQASLASFPSLYRRLGGARLGAVDNGVDLERIDRQLHIRPQRPTSGPFTVISVGRLNTIKRPQTLLTAFQQSTDQNSRLELIGDGHLRSSLATHCRARNLADRVELTGLLPRDEVFRRLAQADLFVSTSAGEGLPLAALEAMACGCPVVLSDISPHRQIARDANFIRLVPPDDVAGFAQQLDRFAMMSAAERQQIGQQGRELVQRMFSMQAMHDGYSQLYYELCGRRLGPMPARHAAA